MYSSGSHLGRLTTERPKSSIAGGEHVKRRAMFFLFFLICLVDRMGCRGQAAPTPRFRQSVPAKVGLDLD